MSKDGVIKFDSGDFTQTDSLSRMEYIDLEKWRKTLHKLNLIGYSRTENVGYGNISKRKNFSSFYSKNTKTQFTITGTQTGKLTDLNGDHYTRVVDFNLTDFSLKIMGPTMASSESITHAAIYSINCDINVIFHIHSKNIWENMIQDNFDVTYKYIPYGTQEMAQAVQEIIKTTSQYSKSTFKTQGYIAMKGHEDGIIVYGPNLETVGNLTINLYKKYIDKSFIL